MIAQERLPTLRRWFSSFDYIFGHARLPDIDSELEQLSVDPRRSPQRIGDAHLADKLAYLRWYSWSATTAPRLPAPIRSEAANRYSPAKIKRSMALNVCLLGECRLSMLI